MDRNNELIDCEYLQNRNYNQKNKYNIIHILDNNVDNYEYILLL